MQKKIEEDMDFLTVLNENSKFFTHALADPNIKNLQAGDLVQFERRGYFIVDKVHKIDGDTTKRRMEMIYIPDGKTKTMSNLGTKVDVGKTAKGKTLDKEEEKKEDKESKPPTEEKKKKKERPPKPVSDKKEDEKEKIDIAHAHKEPLAETDAPPT